MRSTNPENYNENGTIKKHGNKKVVWNKSNHYMKYQNQLKELYRKQADIRKYQHECLANYIISLGKKVVKAYNKLMSNMKDIFEEIEDENY